MESLLRYGLSNAAAAALIALGVSVLGGVLRERPALRHRLWLLVLLKLVTPPIWTVPLPWPAQAPANNVVAAAALEAQANEAAGDANESLSLLRLDLVADAADDPVHAGSAGARRWPRVVAFVWLAGSCVSFAVMALRVRRFRDVLSTTRPAGPDVQAQVAELADRIGLTRAPCVRWVKGHVSPMIWALFCQPCLILPTALWVRLDPAQRETLLVHELAHLRRGDPWVRVLELMVTVLYWWLPVTWWVRRALREAEESCCDAWVTWAYPSSARAYADALVEALDFLSSAESCAPAAASGIGRVSCLKRRLIMIMQRTTPRHLSWGGTLLTVGVSAFLLPLAPAWAQAPSELEEEPQVVVKVSEDRAEPPTDAAPRVSIVRRQHTNQELPEIVPDAAAHGNAAEILKDLLKEIEAGATPGKEGGGSKESVRKALLAAISALERKRSDVIYHVVKPGEREAMLGTRPSAKISVVAQDELKTLQAIVHQKEAELRKSSAELQAARNRLETLASQGGKDGTRDVHVLFRTKVPASGQSAGERAGKTAGPASSEQDARMAKIEAELKRLSEELAKLRHGPVNETPR